MGPGRGCLVCIKALDRDDVSLDIAGKLDDPDYIKNLPKEKQELLSRRNVFPFSMAVAAHETLHFVGCISGLERIAGVGPQVYHCYPGKDGSSPGQRLRAGLRIPRADGHLLRSFGQPGSKARRRRSARASPRHDLRLTARRQGLLQQSCPFLPAPARHESRHLRARRSGRQPPPPRPSRRSASTRFSTASMPQRTRGTKICLRSSAAGETPVVLQRCDAVPKTLGGVTRSGPNR